MNNMSTKSTWAINLIITPHNTTITDINMTVDIKTNSTFIAKQYIDNDRVRTSNNDHKTAIDLYEKRMDILQITIDMLVVKIMKKK